MVDGCTPVSAGCANCWSAAMAHRFHKKYVVEGMDELQSLTDSHGHFKGVVGCAYHRLSIPSRTRKPTVFSVWNDLFHEDVPEQFIDAAIREMLAASQHTYLILTKRPNRMEEMIRLYAQRGEKWSHIWFGTSAENQAALDERLPHLLRVPGNRFLSLEPLLGSIDLEVPYGQGVGDLVIENIHWVVVGAETGPHKRPCDPAWINDIVRQCRENHIPVWVKAAPRGAEVVREKGWK